MKTPLFICIVLFATLGSCKKESPKPSVVQVVGLADTNDCKPLLLPDMTLGCPGCNTDFDESYFSSPAINPNNVHELIYLDGIYPHSKVMFYNSETHEKRVLIDENVASNFSWSKKDWILFQRSSDFNLYKIKSNGDSLTQLTSNGKWFHGSWNYAGDKFIVYQKFNGISKSFIMNSHGNVIDSIINWQHRSGVWSHPLYYLGGSTDEIIIMDIENKTVFKRLNFDQSIGLVGWASMFEVLYRSGSKLYSYDIHTGNSKLIQCECNGAFISNAFSSDFDQLLFVKIEHSLQPNGRIFEDSKLVFMDKVGGNEYEIVP